MKTAPATTARKPRLTRKCGDGRITLTNRKVRGFDWAGRLVFEEHFRSFRESHAFFRRVTRPMP